MIPALVFAFTIVEATSFTVRYVPALFRAFPSRANDAFDERKLARSSRAAHRRRREGKSNLQVRQLVGGPSIDPKCVALPSFRESAAVFVVPESHRDPSLVDRPIKTHVSFVSIADLFPETPELSELFHSDSEFRAALSTAARDDLWVPDPRFSAAKNSQLRASGSTLEGNWERCAECNCLTELFLSRSMINLSGKMFMRRLGSLCITGGNVTAAIACSDAVNSGQNIETSSGSQRHFPVTGSWLDIVSPRNGRKSAAHAWHQDSGLEQWTTMLGFPLSNEYVGPGVFSHCVKLSHAMIPPVNAGPVVFEPLEKGKPVFPEDAVMRPVFRRGSEIIVYCDRDHVHSAPDQFRRDGIWRFM